MWLPDKAFELFQVSKEGVDTLREDLATVRMERDNLKNQLATTQANFAWLMIRVNALELERAQLIEKAYQIKVPAPEIVRITPGQNPLEMNSDLFEDIGDDKARALGLPTYS